MTETGTTKVPSKFQRWFDETIDIGFMCFATLNAVLLLLQMRGWITLSTPLWVLIWAAWCPFFWGKYVAVKRAGHWYMWAVFACSIVFTATTVLAVIAILIRSIG